MISSELTHNAVAITKNTSSDSAAINLGRLADGAKLLLDLLITGDGTAEALYLVSDAADGTFIIPAGSTKIVTGHTKSSGTSGRSLIKFEATPILHEWMKIRVTETANSSNIAATARLVIWSNPN
jgi:hypothetical protein